MASAFFIPYNHIDEIIEVERWLHANIGPQIRETIKNNIKIYNWKTGITYDANWDRRSIRVIIYDDSHAVAFKLRFVDIIKKTVHGDL
jgi:hypothetical protein